MKRVISVLIAVLAIAGCFNPREKYGDRSQLPVWHPDYQTTCTETYWGGEPDADELKDVQCPIPMKDRVRNYTGTQCVFSSLECLARWAECKQLLQPEPLTSRPGCRSYSGPGDAASKLRSFGVKFEDSYQDRVAGVRLIKKAMEEGRGCLWGVPGHAMVICHFDEAKNVVKYIDNSDSSLRIHTITVQEFNRRWDTWVIVVYANPDVVPLKVDRLSLANKIPIVDRNGPARKYPKDYIPKPTKE